MKLKTLALLCLLVAGVGGYVYFAIQKPAEKRALEGEGEVFAPGDLKQISSMTIQIKDLSVTLERQGLFWKITSPVQDLASESKVSSLLVALQKFKQTKVIATEEKLKDKKLGLVQYGLETPKARLTYKASDLKEPVTVSIGDQNPSNSGNYVTRSTDKNVYLAGLDLDYLATQRIDDWREMKLSTVTPEDYAKVQLEARGKRVSLEKINNEWVMLSPYKLPLDAEMVRNFLEKISLIRANNFLTEAPKNLGEPSIKLVIGFKEGAKDLRTTENDPRPQGTEVFLYQIKQPSPFKKVPGAKTEDQELYYAKSDKTALGSIAKFHFENLSKPPEDFIRRTFDDFLISDIQKATLKRAGAPSIQIGRSASQEYELLGAGSESKLNQAKVDDLFRQVRNLRALRFLDEQKSEPKIPASLRIEIELKGGEKRILSLHLKKDVGELYKELDGRWLRFVTSADPLKTSDFDLKNLVSAPPPAPETKKPEEKSVQKE